MPRIRRTAPAPTRWPRLAICIALAGYCGTQLLVGSGHHVYAQSQPAAGGVKANGVRRLPPVPTVGEIQLTSGAEAVDGQPVSYATPAPASAGEIRRLPSSRRNGHQPANIVNQTQFGEMTAELIPPGTTVAETTEALTLSAFENMALANNPTLVQAATRIQAAQGRWVQGGLRPNPLVGYQATEVGNNGTAGQQGAFYSQEFVRGGKLALNQSVASREIAQAQQQMMAQRLRVLNDVRIAYFNVVVAQRARELTGELAEIGKRGQETTERLFQGQQVSNADVLQARIESASTAIILQNANNRFAAAWRTLSSVVGTPEMMPHEVSGDLTTQLAALDWGEAYTRLITQSPELASARAGVSRARAILERARVEPIPNLDVQLGVQYDNSSQYTIANIQAGVPIPFSNRNQGNVQTAYADLRNAQAEIARIELSLRNRLASAFENYANARNQVDTFSQQILPDARSSLDLVSTGYRQGQVSFLALLTAQRTNAQANLAYLQALQELNANRIAIEGLLLTGSLQGGGESIAGPGPTEAIAPVFGPGKPPVERQ